MDLFRIKWKEKNENKTATTPWVNVHFSMQKSRSASLSLSNVLLKVLKINLDFKHIFFKRIMHLKICRKEINDHYHCKHKKILKLKICFKYLNLKFLHAFNFYD